VLQNLFSLLLNSGDPRPDFVASRCLVERHAVGGCDRCETACPHEAVLIGTRVTIFEESCTGCGLCVQACPTGALEYDLNPVLKTLKAQGINLEAEDPTVRVSLKCSQVPGDTPTVSCLGRVTPAAMMASAAWGQHLRLIHADCQSCALGSADVPEQLRTARDTAERAHGLGRVSGIEPWRRGNPVPERRSPTPGVSRREALQHLFGGAGQGAAKLVPDALLPGVSTRSEPGRIPTEWVWRARATRGKPTRPRHLPVVNESCQPCRVCETVCPTGALKLTQGEVLTLEVEACIACPACVSSCPTGAVSLREVVPPLESVVTLHTAVVK
jgi:ferredoxin